MNNNRGTGRRRGRGNNRPTPSGRGGMDQGNRIDNRARGNAAQLLEKYKKLAHEAQMNGDRVNTEYYLQFVDHYFRVMADNRSRQEENRRPRDDGRDDNRDDNRESDRYDGDDDDDNGFDNDRNDNFGNSFNGNDDRNNRPPRREPRDNSRRDQPRRDRPQIAADNSGNNADNQSSARDDEGSEPSRPRRNNVPRKPIVNAAEGRGLDPSSLPPAIGARAADDADAKPVKRRGRPPKARTDDDSGDLETVAAES